MEDESEMDCFVEKVAQLRERYTDKVQVVSSNLTFLTKIILEMRTLGERAPPAKRMVHISE